MYCMLAGPGDILGSHCDSNGGSMLYGLTCARDSVVFDAVAVLTAWLVDLDAGASVLARDPVCATTWASTG
jgi:hypothetical protein